VNSLLTRTLRTTLAALLLATTATTFVSPATASRADAPCWKTLLNDWYDGHIDKTYAIPCYQQAINHLPTDVSVYSSARDDIRAAENAAIAAANGKGTTTTTPTTVTQSTDTTPATTTTEAPGNTKPTGPIPSVIVDASPGGATSFPLPLVILGGLAVLLVAAGIGGLLWRRFRAGS
jgi:hypothetical protein